MSGNKNIHGTYELYVDGYIYYTTMSGAWNLEGWRAYQEYIKAEVLNRNLPFWGVCVDAREWEGFIPEVWEQVHKDGHWSIEHHLVFNGMAVSRSMFQKMLGKHMDETYPGFDYKTFSDYDECVAWCKDKELEYSNRNFNLKGA